MRLGPRQSGTRAGVARSPSPIGRVVRSRARREEGRMSGAKIALVTGAGSGIGKAVALALMNDGYNVVLSGRRREPLEETAREGKNGFPVPADVTDAVSVAALFSAIEQRFGRLDLLFNNAGVNAPAIPIEELPIEKW